MSLHLDRPKVHQSLLAMHYAVRTFHQHLAWFSDCGSGGSACTPAYVSARSGIVHLDVNGKDRTIFMTTVQFDAPLYYQSRSGSLERIDALPLAPNLASNGVTADDEVPHCWLPHSGLHECRNMM